MTKKRIESVHTWKFQLYFSAKQSTKFVWYEDLVFSFISELWEKPDTGIFGPV